MPEQASCPVCGCDLYRDSVPNAHKAQTYGCRHCGNYILWDIDHADFLKGSSAVYANERFKISALLRERKSNGLPSPQLCFRKGEKYPELAGFVQLWTCDLIDAWPKTLEERLERIFLNIVREQGINKSFDCETRLLLQHGTHHAFFFTSRDGERDYMLKELKERNWVKQREDHDAQYLLITPSGWAKYEHLTQESGNIRNHAFIAMWFGTIKTMGREVHREDEMRALFHDAIKPAVVDAGFDAKRADTDEHNEPIMDRVVADIRKAPFVIADLTENNQGVYFEAGFARGLGKPIIYCSPKDQGVHFDVTAISRVIWGDYADLRTKLRDRILGSIGVGPYMK